MLDEKNYYPFGLQHRGYNFANSPLGNATAKKFGFGRKELSKELGLDSYDFGARNYDPTIARWTTIDPVTHFNMSSYTAFDNNPVYFADPSGTTTVSSIQEAWDATPENGRTTWNSNGEGGFCDDCPKEGQTKQVPGVQLGVDGPLTSETLYYHRGLFGGSKAGWYSQRDYFELFRKRIRAIGQGQASIESLHKYGFTDEVFKTMVGWAIKAYSYYGGKVPLARGNINAMGFDSPVFMLGSLRALGSFFVRSNGVRKGLVDLSEETFSQALFKGAEKMGEYSIYGTKGLVGKTFTRNIFLIQTETKSLSAFRTLVNSLESEALKAGANKISIFGSSVINKGFLNPNIMKRFGYSFKQTNNGILLQKTLR
ncbi:MAG: hypothetical protein OIF50_02415 [Flavobacteriaceae bacterium]|nr:hypothetical protein [Flavobacteriaceae bacterium]